MSELSEFRRQVLKKSQQALSAELGYEKWTTYAAQEQGKNPLPAEIKALLRGRKYKFEGRFPDEEEAQEAPAPAGGPYVTEKAFEDVPGRLKRLEEDSRAVLPLVQAVRDLDARVRELEKRLERSE